MFTITGHVVAINQKEYQGKGDQGQPETKKMQEIQVMIGSERFKRIETVTDFNMLNIKKDTLQTLNVYIKPWQSKSGAIGLDIRTAREQGDSKGV